jgi:hypothetical protein
MVDDSIRTGQEPVAASGVMTPAGALQALAGGAPGAITVAGTAQEVSAHFGDLAVAAGAGSIASITVTDGAPLAVSKADFRANATAYAQLLQIITARPLQVKFH